VATLPCPWLDAVSPIWRDTPAPYGPLFVLIAAAAVWLGGSLTGVIVVLRVLTLAGLLAVVKFPGAPLMTVVLVVLLVLVVHRTERSLSTGSRSPARAGRSAP
jgi:O-antigen ligase